MGKFHGPAEAPSQEARGVGRQGLAWGLRRRPPRASSDFASGAPALRLCFPGPLQKQLPPSPDPAGWRQTSLPPPVTLATAPLCPETLTPPPSTRVQHTYPKPCCPNPAAHWGSRPRGAAQRGSRGREGGETGWGPHPGQVAPEDRALALRWRKEGRFAISFSILSCRLQANPNRPRRTSWPRATPGVPTLPPQPTAYSRGRQSTCSGGQLDPETRLAFSPRALAR